MLKELHRQSEILREKTSGNYTPILSTAQAFKYKSMHAQIYHRIRKNRIKGNFFKPRPTMLSEPQFFFKKYQGEKTLWSVLVQYDIFLKYFNRGSDEYTYRV